MVCAWSVKGEQGQACKGEGEAGLDMSPQAGAWRGQAGQGGLRARGLPRGCISAAVHHICAWHGVWRLPALWGGTGKLSL